MNRRSFIKISTLAAAGALGTSCGPRAATSTSSGVFDVGAETDFSQDGVKSDWAFDHGFLVIRHAGKLYATSAICTHQACIISPVGDHLACPCHGSQYAISGKLTVGPAAENLARFEVSKDKSGRINVNTSKRFGPEEWDSPGAFLPV